MQYAIAKLEGRSPAQALDEATSLVERWAGLTGFDEGAKAIIEGMRKEFGESQSS